MVGSAGGDCVDDWRITFLNMARAFSAIKTSVERFKSGISEADWTFDVGGVEGSRFIGSDTGVKTF